MAGKNCNGVAAYSAVKVRNSKSFCEGYVARTVSTTPTNPHVAGSEANAAFAAGAAAKLGEASTDVDRACCAATGLDAAV